jgi:plasmid stabilization system protein ParE
MVKKIVWTKRAINKFNHIIAYLEQEWGVKTTQNFVKKTYNVIELLSRQPELGNVGA